MAEPVEKRCLSPLEWRLGFLKSIVFFGALVIAMIVAKSRIGSEALSLVPVFGLLAALIGLYFWPSKVSLLEDGLAYKRYGFTKFIPYAKIRSAELIQRFGGGTSTEGAGGGNVWTIYCAIRLRLEGGDTFDIGTSTQELRDRPLHVSRGDYGHFCGFDHESRELERALGERLRVVHSAPERTDPIAEGLLRGDKTLTEWLQAINASAPARGDAYRGADGVHEALWRVLEDETSPREARAGAALALRTHLDEEGRHRLRVVVDGCESPKLRVALETALDEDAGEPRVLHALAQASLPRDKS